MNDHHRGIHTSAGRSAVAAVGALTLALLTGCASGTTSAAPTESPAAVGSSAGEPTPSTSAVGTTTPTPSATTTADASAFRLNDPSTWTISGAEVGPIALGGRTDAETDDLAVAYTRTEGSCPAAPSTQVWGNDEENPGLTITSDDGLVTGVAIGNHWPDAVAASSPKTEAGAGVGTTLDELRAMYPRLVSAGMSYPEGYALWTIGDHGRSITFDVQEATGRVGMVWVSAQTKPPIEFCG